MSVKQINRPSKASVGPGNRHLTREMFRIGKRRPEEEEDSLVPHGMIWYATPEEPAEGDTREAPPEPGDESIEQAVHYAQVMEIMRRRAREPADKPLQESGSEREPAATGVTPPAPVPWWRIPHPDPEPEASALSLPGDAAVTPPGAAVTPRPNPAFPLKIEALTAPLAGPAPSDSAAISEIGNEVREVKEIEEVRAVESEAESEDKDKVNDKDVNDKDKDAVKQERPSEAHEGGVSTASAAIADFARSSLAGSRQLAAEGKKLFSQVAAKAISQRPALRWKPPRVRIVLTGLPLRIKILVARQLSEWNMQPPSATTDTGGLRVAVIIAAACAVLGLICVLLAPHFAAGFLPSRSLPPSSTVGRKTAGRPAPAAAPPAQSAAGPGSQPQKGKPSSSAPAAKAREEKPSPDPEAQRKHRRTGDDDYVAPDTYKYYGK